MKASALFGRAPSSFLGGREWGQRDHLLVYAYQLYLELVCPVCGGSVLVCRNEANAGLFELQESTCHRRVPVDEKTRQKDFKAEPGQLLYGAPIDDDLVKGSGLLYPPNAGGMQATGQ